MRELAAIVCMAGNLVKYIAFRLLLDIIERVEKERYLRANMSRCDKSFNTHVSET